MVIQKENWSSMHEKKNLDATIVVNQDISRKIAQTLVGFATKLAILRTIVGNDRRNKRIKTEVLRNRNGNKVKLSSTALLHLPPRTLS
jgi:hypothetical protein